MIYEKFSDPATSSTSRYLRLSPIEAFVQNLRGGLGPDRRHSCRARWGVEREPGAVFIYAGPICASINWLSPAEAAPVP